jgi:PIN domain nuclease of toxin-antitoxin system
MNVLLDTHVMLWALMAPKKLTKTARRVLEKPSTLVHISAVSAWEIATKVRIGKLDVNPAILADFSGTIARLAAVECPVRAEHGIAAGGFPTDHRDPFDRMLAAQASVDGFALMTSDEIFTQFPVTVLWSH